MPCLNTLSESMVVHDLHVQRFAVFPQKADAPLLVDADAVLALAIALERFELISRRHAQIAEIRGRIKILQLLSRTLLDLSVKPLHELAVKDGLGTLVLERTNHLRIVT